jgi:hypothetical protein
VFIGGSDARIIIGPDEAALQCYGEKAGRWGHMTFRVTCWSSWGSQRQGRSEHRQHRRQLWQRPALDRAHTEQISAQ